MRIAWGLVVTAVSVVCWGGQAVTWSAPRLAVRLGLTEAESEVDPVFGLDARGEAFWDLLVLWTMPVAGVLLTLDQRSWPYFALAGGGAYVYFAGRGIVVRLTMRRRGVRIGSRKSVKVGLAALAVWGAVGAAMIVSAVVALDA